LNLRDKVGIDRGTALTAFHIQKVRQLSSIESVLVMDEWNLTTTDGDLAEDVVALFISPNPSRISARLHYSAVA